MQKKTRLRIVPTSSRAENEARNNFALLYQLGAEIISRPIRGGYIVETRFEKNIFLSRHSLDSLRGIEFQSLDVDPACNLTIREQELLRAMMRGETSTYDDSRKPIRDEIRIPTTYPGIPDEMEMRFPMVTVDGPLGMRSKYDKMLQAVYEFDRVDIKVELVYKFKGVET